MRRFAACEGSRDVWLWIGAHGFCCVCGLDLQCLSVPVLRSTLSFTRLSREGEMGGLEPMRGISLSAHRLKRCPFGYYYS